MKLLQNCAKLNRQKYHFEGTTMDSQILHIFYHDIDCSRIVLNGKDIFNDYYVADMSYNGALMAEHFREGFILGARIAPEICGFGKLDKK